MKRLYFILAALLLMVVAPSVKAAWVVTEDRVPASQVKTGQYYVIETSAYSGWAGHYLKSGTTQQPSAVDSLCVWELVDAGTNEYTKEPQYYLKNFKTGLYLQRNYLENVEQAEASKWLIHATNAAAVAYNGDSLFFSPVVSTSFSPGWDENSVTIAQTEWDNDDNRPYVYFLANWWNYNNTTYWTYRDTSPWSFHEVENDNNNRNDLQAVVDEYDANDYDNYFPASDVQPFATKVVFVEAMKEAYAEAVEVLADESTTNDQVIAAQIKLQNAIIACRKTENQNPLVDGYYYIVTSNANFTSKADGAGRMAWCNLASYPNNLRWQLLDTSNKAPYLWKVTLDEDGNALIQNMSTARYIDGSASTDAWMMVNDGARVQTVKNIGKGEAIFRPKGQTGAYKYAHQGGHGGGTGTMGNIVDWSYEQSNGTAWHFENETDQSFIDSLENAIKQAILDNTLSDLISEANSKISASTVKGLFGTGVVATSGSQYSSNATETSAEGMTADEAYAHLCDGNTSTYFHTAWSSSADTDDPFHYLQVKANGELPTSLQIYWWRRITNNNNRPTNVGISVSADGETWTTVIDSLKGMPTAADMSYYISDPITIPAGNKYFRMTVYETNNGALSPKGHPFFTFSEFNLYESVSYDVDPSKSQSSRPEVAEQVTVLQTAVDAANAVETGKTTQADIDALQTAIDAFDAVWADTTEFVSAIEKAEGLLLNAVPGDEIGQFPESSISGLQFLLEAVKLNRPLYNKTKATIDEYTKTMTEELNKYMASMVVPSENKWYYIVSNVSTSIRAEEGDNAQPTREQAVYASGYSAGSNVVWGGKAADNVSNARAAWKFIKQDDGTYAIQNMGSGWYLGQGGTSGTTVQLSDTLVKYNFVPLAGNAAGDEESASAQIGLECAANPILLHAQWAGKRLVNWTSNPAGNSPCAWTFEEVPTEEQQEIKSFAQNRYYVVTVPYATIDVPSASDGTEISLYTLTGATRNDEGTISELKFSSYTGTTLIPGTPYLMKVGEKATTGEDEGNDVLVDMMVDAESTELTTTPLAVNGLQGVLTDTDILKVGYGYFTSDESVQTTDGEEEVTIGAQEGYIIAQDVTEVEGAANDLIITVSGDGLVNKIKGATVTENEIVNVYTIDGVLVKKNVKAATAAQGLQKGVYIIGNKKAIVK